jgi:predicted metal-binding membrane protein
VGGVSRSVVSSGHAGRSELAVAFSAGRARLGVVVVLLALAALAWWLTAVRMAGMDAGPGTDIGALGWFLGVWVVMMAAMMFPSLAPTVALYARMTRRRGLDHALLFAGGYLLVWGGAGLGAYGLFRIGREVFGGGLAWHAGGRWFAAGVLALAALYEVTPVKDVCLAKCRSPIGFLLGSWRDGRLGALEMGSRHGGWCLGCCWALMAALFALGVMSIAWMVVVAGMIAIEKLLPWKALANRLVATTLLVLGLGIALVPGHVPALTLPGSPAAARVMHAMPGMQAMPAKRQAPGMNAMPGG